MSECKHEKMTNGRHMAIASFCRDCGSSTESVIADLRARVQELEAELEGLAEDVRLPDIEAITRCRIRVRRIKRLTPPEDSSTAGKPE